MNKPKPDGSSPLTKEGEITDHLGAALERALSERQGVRNWVQPNTRALPAGRAAAPTFETPPRRVELSLEELRRGHFLCAPGVEDPRILDTYRLLRTRVLQQMKASGQRSLGITSPGAGAGKTLTSVNLAMSIARDDANTVVLIDADLRKPSIAQDLGIPVEKGLIDLLSSDDPLESVLMTAGMDNLLLLPGRRDHTLVTPELLHSPRMNQLVRWFDKPNTIVIVDLPPVLVGDDVLALAPSIDSLLVIVEEGGTDTAELKRTAELLQGFTVLGTVLNKSKERTASMDGYYHHYGSGG